MKVKSKRKKKKGKQFHLVGKEQVRAAFAMKQRGPALTTFTGKSI